MSKYILLVSVFFISFTSMYSQCGETLGEILLETEEEILEYADCDTIFGSLTISGTDISYLDGLQNIKHIEGNFTIESCISLLNVDSLYRLNSIGGNLKLQSNFTLLNVNGFSDLEYIGGDFSCVTNWSIVNFEGMEALSIINGDVFLDNNNTLESLIGLDNLAAVNGSFTLLTSNMVFDEIGVNNLQWIENDLIVSVNSLNTINGFEGLTEIGGNLELIDLTLLANVNGFSALESIGNDLVITNDSTLVNVDSLYNLTYVGGDLKVHSNPGLFLCCGLNTILANGTVDGEIQVYDNNSACSDVETIVEDCWVSVSEESQAELNIYRSNSNQMIVDSEIIIDSIEVFDLFGRKLLSKDVYDFSAKFTLPNYGLCIWTCTRNGIFSSGIL